MSGLTSECHRNVGVNRALKSGEFSPVYTTWTSSSPSLLGIAVVA
jgi:hypothetical protein